MCIDCGFDSYECPHGLSINRPGPHAADGFRVAKPGYAGLDDASSEGDDRPRAATPPRLAPPPRLVRVRNGGTGEFVTGTLVSSNGRLVHRLLIDGEERTVRGRIWED